jgi:hypothetical protein
MNDQFKIGDIVRITDGSYAVRVDEYEKYTSIGLCRDLFEVIKKGEEYLYTKGSGILTHDIFIKNTTTGAIYLHSSSCVKRVCQCCKCPCCGRNCDE